MYIYICIYIYTPPIPLSHPIPPFLPSLYLLSLIDNGTSTRMPNFPQILKWASGASQSLNVHMGPAVCALKNVMRVRSPIGNCVFVH